MTSPDLETRIDRALKDLPEPKAPGTLLPAVMLAVRAAAVRPWYARPWTSWPGQWQAASATVFVLLVAGISVLFPVVQPGMGISGGGFDTLMAPINAVFSRLDLVVTLIEILTRTLWQSVIGVGIAMVLIMLATTVAVGAALGRVALGGAKQS